MSLPSSRTLAAILETALAADGVATLAVAPSGEIVHASGGFLELVELGSEAVHGVSLDALVRTLRDKGPTTSSVAGVLTDARASGGDGYYDLALADQRILEWSVHTIDDGSRLWVFRNVTVYRHTVRALQNGESWLHMLSAHAEGVLLEVDSNARIIGQWSQDTSLLDASEEGFYERTLVEVLGPTQGPLFERALRDAIATGRPASFEYVVERPEGRRVFTANAVQHPVDEAAPPTVSVLIRDVTERARLQHQLLQAERLASLGLLAAGVAHEVNNPLTYMLLNLQHVRRGLSELTPSIRTQDFVATVAEFQRCVAMAVEGAMRVQEIVKDLRRFSRSDEHEPPKLVDVRDVLTFTLAMTSTEVQRRARIVREFGHVPMVVAGEGRLHQVFLNLIINAVQAIEDGGSKENEVRVVTLTAPDGSAIVEVHDTGTGIPEAHLSKLFDPFFTTKPAGVGTGLGLAICHGITTSFGGQLTVQSQVGRGSTFRVALPAARPSDSRIPAGTLSTVC